MIRIKLAGIERQLIKFTAAGRQINKLKLTWLALAPFRYSGLLDFRSISFDFAFCSLIESHFIAGAA